MSFLHRTYRTGNLLFPVVCRNFAQILALLFYGSLQLSAAQTAPAPSPAVPTKNAVVKSATAALPVSTQAAASSAAPQPAQQSASVAAMLASADKQRAAVKAQAGPAAANATDSFFSTPWTTPATIPVPAVVPSCIAMPDADLKPLIDDAAKAQALKPELIRAVIRRESASYPCAISEKGAIGLMQLMPDVAQQLGADPFDPQQNVQAGSRYLKQLMSRYKGDLKLALAAYNAGPQTVDAQNKVPDIPETTAYVDAILKDLKETDPSKP
jgi:soluble lytic murein transglycosylase-like protein